MASYTEKNTIKFYDKLGNEHKIYPKTTVDQVVGLESKIAELQEDSKVVDTYGITGTVGANVKPQNMFDVIGNFIKNLAITTSNFANNFKARLKNDLNTTDEGYGLDARQGRTLSNNISTLSDSVDSRLQVINTSIEALEQSTEHMIAAKIILDKDDWVNNAQTITVSGMQSENDMCIFICPFASSTETFVSNNIICNVQSIDTLGFKCDTVPNVDVEIYLVLKSATTEEDLANLEIALTEAYQVIQRINASSATAEQNITSLNTQNQTASSNISSLQSLNQTASGRIDSLTTAITDGDVTLSSITAQNNMATSNITDLGLANNTASTNISDLGTENTNATSNISNLQSAISSASSNISSLNTANTTASTNINTLDGINSTAAQNISDINTATSDGQTVLGSLSAMNTTASETLADLQEANDSALENIDQLDLENKTGKNASLEDAYTYFGTGSNGYDYMGVDFNKDSATNSRYRLQASAEGNIQLYQINSSHDGWNLLSSINPKNTMVQYANPTLTEDQLYTLPPGMYMYQTAYSWLPTGCNGYGTIVSFLTNNAYGVIQIFDTNGNVYSRHHNSTSWHHGWQTLYKTPIHALAQVTTGGDTTYTGKIVFNNALQNYGNCYNTSTGEFTCPVNGVYAMSFGYYSNNTAVNSRPAIMVNGSMVTMHNGAYGHDLSVTRVCAAGDKITAGAYSSSYPISLYAGGGHNHFSVTLIQQIP